MIDGPAGAGLWAIWHGSGGGDYLSYEAPVQSFVADFESGVHYFGVGTPYQSVGNTGLYEVALVRLPDGELLNSG